MRPFRIRVHPCSSLLFLDEATPVRIDLSKAKKLRDVVFRPGLRNVEWIPMTLQTITPAHRDLRQISIYIPYELVNPMFSYRPPSTTELCELWSNLDHLLLRFWESRSIHPKVVSATLRGEGRNTWMKDNVESFLPEVTRRGVIDLGE